MKLGTGKSPFYTDLKKSCSQHETTKKKHYKFTLSIIISGDSPGPTLCTIISDELMFVKSDIFFLTFLTSNALSNESSSSPFHSSSKLPTSISNKKNNNCKYLQNVQKKNTNLLMH